MITVSEKLRLAAHEQFSGGKYREAAANCIRAVTASPASPWPYLLLAKCYVHLRRHKAAKACAERFLVLLPKGSSPSSELQAKSIISQTSGQ